MGKKIGIYKITSPSGKIYIGQSIDINRRINSYKNLRCKHQQKLLNSLKKYGFDKHTFEILIECNRQELNYLEKHYVDYYKCFDTEMGLNLRDGGGSKSKVSSETKERMRKANIGKKLTPEHILKIKNSNKGVKRSEETKLKMSQSRKGMVYSEEHRKNIGKKSAARIVTIETRLKMSIAHKRKLK